SRLWKPRYERSSFNSECVENRRYGSVRRGSAKCDITHQASKSILADRSIDPERKGMRNPFAAFSTEPWKNVLVPLDGSEESTSILDQARPLLARESLAVTFLRVIECSESHAQDPAYLTDSRHWKDR